MSRSVATRLRTLALAVFSTVTLLGASACTVWDGDTRIMVSTEPGGAEILVNGKNTGHTTPHMIDLEAYGSQDHLVTMRKSGYTTEKRQVFYHSTFSSSVWEDGASSLFTPFSLPLFWTFGDLFVPWEYRWVYVPHELHVRLYAAGDAPKQDPGTTSTGIEK